MRFIDIPSSSRVMKVERKCQALSDKITHMVKVEDFGPRWDATVRAYGAANEEAVRIARKERGEA